MKILVVLILILPFLSEAQMKTPVAPKIPKKMEIHNHTRIDNYYWMNQRDSKGVLAYIEEENAYQEAYFKPLQPMIDKLMNEFDQIINPNETSSPLSFKDEHSKLEV